MFEAIKNNNDSVPSRDISGLVHSERPTSLVAVTNRWLRAEGCEARETMEDGKRGVSLKV